MTAEAATIVLVFANVLKKGSNSGWGLRGTRHVGSSSGGKLLLEESVQVMPLPSTYVALEQADILGYTSVEALR